jgi:hypothetical protein
MEVMVLEKEVDVIAFKVDSFPDGIGEAFDKLANGVTNLDRSFYGICYCHREKVSYYAACEMKEPSDADAIPAIRLKIDKGSYLAEPLWNWRKNIDEIHEIFERMMQDKRVKSESTCIEWYKDDNVMWCMVKLSNND